MGRVLGWRTGDGRSSIGNWTEAESLEDEGELSERDPPPKVISSRSSWRRSLLGDGTAPAVADEKGDAAAEGADDWRSSCCHVSPVVVVVAAAESETEPLRGGRVARCWFWLRKRPPPTRPSEADSVRVRRGVVMEVEWLDEWGRRACCCCQVRVWPSSFPPALAGMSHSSAELSW